MPNTPIVSQDQVDAIKPGKMKYHAKTQLDLILRKQAEAERLLQACLAMLKEADELAIEFVSVSGNSFTMGGIPYRASCTTDTRISVAGQRWSIHRDSSFKRMDDE